jgi:Abortive infection alpha
MDANELLKHAPELLKGGTELVKAGAEVAGAFKFTDIIKTFLGPASAEIAERFRDEARLYRFGRQLECLKKAEKMAKDAGFTPKAVPIKLLFPLLEGASLEENEDLHTMWAALLANAASPNNAEKVRPRFIAILNQMAPDEAVLLKGAARITEEHGLLIGPSHSLRIPTEEWRIALRKAKLDMEAVLAKFRRHGEAEFDMKVRLDTCSRLLATVGLIVYGDDSTLLVSSVGKSFFECCEPPKPSE